MKFCRNARDFSSENFEKAVHAGRCCETNYFSGSYTRGLPTGIDGNTLKDDGGEKLGQCEGFEMTTGPFEMLLDNENKNAVCFDNIGMYGNTETNLTSSTLPTPFKTCSMPNVWAEESHTKFVDDYHECFSYYNFASLKSSVKCHLNSKINLSHLRIGLCNREYAASYDPFTITICDEKKEDCCPTNNLNTNEFLFNMNISLTDYLNILPYPFNHEYLINTLPFNNYGMIEDGSYIKDINTLFLGSCKDKLLSDSVQIFVNVQGSDGMCVDYFQLGEKLDGSLNNRTSTTCQHAEVYAESNKVKICPRDIRYEKAPIHCQGSEGNTLKRIAMKVSDKDNAGTTDEIKLIIRNSDGTECETKNLPGADTDNYQEYTNLGKECMKLEISDYVHVWVATVNHNDNLFLTHLYLDVANENGQTKQMACMLDQNEEFFVIVHGNKERFGVPLKCM